MEPYPPGDTSAVLSFVSAWTRELHALGYESGVYSSSGSGIKDLAGSHASAAMPGVVFDALWNGQASTSDPNLPSADWAVHQRIHQYGGDVTQTYGGYRLAIDQDYLDVNVTALTSGGAPAIYDPAAGHLEVYATGTGGTLAQDSWAPGTGWSGWTNLGGAITGTPGAVYNPASHHLEVYATGTGGTLERDSWAPGTGWSGWTNLGGAVTGSPSAVYDPATSNLEVYAVTSSGKLRQAAWNSAVGWRASTIPAGLTGSPAAVYNPASHHLEVYATGTGGTLEQNSWAPATGWSGWTNLGGSLIAESPSALRDPATGNLEVYAVTSSGKLRQAAWNPAAGWRTANLGGNLAGL
jgi:hypothetical protein